MREKNGEDNYFMNFYFFMSFWMNFLNFYDVKLVPTCVGSDVGTLQHMLTCQTSEFNGNNICIVVKQIEG